MTSDPIRDQIGDHLLTPENAALVIIDFQPVQVNSIKSMDQKEMVRNVVKLAEFGKLYNLPTVLTTVNVATGANKPTISELTDALPGIESIDRTTINSWEDKEFREAVNATGRRKLIMVALWTEACLSFPALDALRAGYEVYPVVDAMGGTSRVAHDTALMRLQQAGAQLTSVTQVACELQRDWNRKDTANQFAEILFRDMNS